MRLLSIGRNFWLGLFLVVAATGLASSASAQAFRVMAGPAVTFPMNSNATGYGMGLGLDLQGRYVMDSRVGLGVNTGAYYNGLKNAGNTLNNWFTLVPAAIAAEYYFLPSTSRVRPYVGLETGAYLLSTHNEMRNEFGNVRSTNHSTVDAGAAPSIGAQFWVAPNIGINLKSNYRYILSDRGQSGIRSQNLQLWNVAAGIELEF